MTSPGRARRVVAIVTVSTLSVAALMGVLVLLGGELGDGAGQVLVTTLLVGAASIAVLCYLATADSPLWPAGAVGGVLVLVPLLSGLSLIWLEPPSYESDWIYQLFGVGAVLAVSWAQVCLLLAVTAGRRPGAVLVMRLTLLAVALVAVGMVAVVLGEDLGDAGFRGLGIAAILDLLGSVTTVVLARAGVATTRDVLVRVPPALLAGLDREVAATGSDRETVLLVALREHVGTRTPRE